MTTADPVLAVTDLRVEKDCALLLDIPRLTLDAGKTLALIGPNGAGKSSLLLALAGIMPLASGVVLFHGAAVTGSAASLAFRRRIAMVFQEPLLFNATVFDNVATGLKLRGIAREEISRRVLASLERFRISHLKERRARTLSGGEAQRTSLARAMAVAPEVLFLDEPFAALDPQAREAIMDDLAATLKETATTAVFATHDRLEAIRLADLVAVLAGGRILQQGTPAEVIQRPADRFVARFVGTENILPARVTTAQGGQLTAMVAGQEMTAPGANHVGAEVFFCIRPESIRLAPRVTSGQDAISNSYDALITRVVPLGPMHKVLLDCGFPLVACVINHQADELILVPGKRITAICPGNAIHIVRS